MRGLAKIAVIGFGLGFGLGFGPGCTGDTEILLRVTRDAAVPADIPKLRVYVAVAQGQVGSQQGPVRIYVDADDPLAEVDLAGRDLLTDPYKLLVQPGGNLPGAAELQVAAMGFKDTPNGRRVIGFGAIDHTIRFKAGSTLAWDVTLAPLVGGTIGVDPLGCIDFKVGDTPVHIGAHDDWDCDGDKHDTDCDDLNPAVNHAASEVCGNAIDEDCSGAFDDDTDNDRDGQTACGGDCIDNPAAQLPDGLTAGDVHAGATEVANNPVDENCDGTCGADLTIDMDKDLYTTTGIQLSGATAGFCMMSDQLADCADGDKAIHPGAAEVITNGLDDDCDGHCDTDADGDTFTPSGFVDAPVMGVCPAIGGDKIDCDDDPNDDPVTGPKAMDIHPGAAEICDGIDEDCDGQCDADVDRDGYSVCGTVNTQNGGVCAVVTSQCMTGEQCDCAPDAIGAHPIPPAGQAVPERCDGYDENCDGVPYPKDNGCFTPGLAQQCLAGTRECKDDQPSMPWDTCNADGSNIVDPALCSAYDACFLDPTVVDPFACAMMRATLTTFSCTESVSGTTACQPATLLIPSQIAAAQCDQAVWSILGGSQQGGWTVGFKAAGGTADTVMGCNATLTVTAWNHNAGGPRRVLVVQRLGGAQGSVFVDLSALSSGVCSTGNNLVCVQAM